MLDKLELARLGSGRWRGMMARCYDKECTSYKYYGARGIKVCERWHDKINFLNDTKEGYFEGAQIDRINNDGDYTPDNTKWSTRVENCNNRRSSVIVEHNGEHDTITNHARNNGLKPTLVMERIRDGWTAEEALSKPVADIQENILKAQAIRWAGHTKQPKQPKTDRRMRVVTYKDKEYTIRHLSNLCGVSHRLLAKRIFERNWSVERAAETLVG